MARRRPALVVPGFRFAAVRARIRLNRPDLALIAADAPCAAAGVFTQNRVRAAPVILSEQRLGRGRCQALIVNSGNANACTGARGMRDARAMAAAAARALGIPPRLVCVASTGVIGRPLPIERIAAAAPALAAALDPGGASSFAQAILTTDNGPKVARARGVIGGHPVRVVGIAKGAGMIAPHMATMLAFVTTDAAAHPAWLRAVLREVADRTFNAVTVDGDTSTNDSLFLLASGAAGNEPVRGDTPEARALGRLIERVCAKLSEMLVADGEGATRVVRVEVRRAATVEEARQVARAIAESLLVKTAIHGADPNWGRIVCAAGYSGVPILPHRLALDIGPVAVLRRGSPVGNHRSAARAVMQRARYPIRLSIGRGRARAHVTTCDLSREYIRINADYTT